MGAEDATIAALGLEFGAATDALVEILASVRRHRFLFCDAALGTSNNRLKDHGVRHSFGCRRNLNAAFTQDSAKPIGESASRRQIRKAPAIINLSVPRNSASMSRFNLPRLMKAYNPTAQFDT